MSPQPMIGSKGRTVSAPVDTGINKDAVNITTAGIILRLPFNARTLVERIMVELISGDATKFSVELLDLFTNPDTLNTVYDRVDIVSLLDDNDNSFKFLNQEGQGADEIYVKLVPDTGINNNFAVRIIGSVLPFKK